MTNAEKLAEALARASNPTSARNIARVLDAAEAAGITDAIPGVNVLTFNAWKAKGRFVRKGEHALCKLETYYERTIRDPATGEESTRKHHGFAPVFHISQTEAKS